MLRVGTTEVQTQCEVVGGRCSGSVRERDPTFGVVSMRDMLLYPCTHVYHVI